MRKAPFGAFLEGFWSLAAYAHIHERVDCRECDPRMLLAVVLPEGIVPLGIAHQHFKGFGAGRFGLAFFGSGSR